jgi:hypothetical protein
MKKKLIDDNGKIFGFINIIDFCVLVLLLIVAIGTFYKFKSHATNINGSSQKIHYQILIKDVKKSSVKFYQKNLSVSDSKTGVFLGTITNFSIKDYYDYVTDINGVVHYAQKPDKIQILLDVEANAVETEQAYLIGGTYELKSGADIYIMTKYADVIGTVEKIGD